MLPARSRAMTSPIDIWRQRCIVGGRRRDAGVMSTDGRDVVRYLARRAPRGGPVPLSRQTTTFSVSLRTQISLSQFDD